MHVERDTKVARLDQPLSHVSDIPSKGLRIRKEDYLLLSDTIMISKKRQSKAHYIPKSCALPYSHPLQS